MALSEDKVFAMLPVLVGIVTTALVSGIPCIWYISGQTSRITTRQDSQDGTIAQIVQRIENDERESKASQQIVNTLDVRLARIEAQIDFLVNNFTAGGGRPAQQSKQRGNDR